MEGTYNGIVPGLAPAVAQMTRAEQCEEVRKAYVLACRFVADNPAMFRPVDPPARRARSFKPRRRKSR